MASSCSSPDSVVDEKTLRMHCLIQNMEHEKFLMVKFWVVHMYKKS